jgi:phage baseplate assembly protein W
MGIEDFLGRGWKYPIFIENDKIASSGGEDSIKESIIIILTTGKGERVMRPDFGCRIYELAFALNDTSTASLIQFYIQEALLKWEPRIEVLDISVAPDEDEGNLLSINIEYMVKTTNTRDNLVYPFYLDKGGI